MDVDVLFWVQFEWWPFSSSIFSCWLLPAYFKQGSCGFLCLTLYLSFPKVSFLPPLLVVVADLMIGRIDRYDMLLLLNDDGSQVTCLLGLDRIVRETWLQRSTSLSQWNVRNVEDWHEALRKGTKDEDFLWLSIRRKKPLQVLSQWHLNMELLELKVHLASFGFWHTEMVALPTEALATAQQYLVYTYRCAKPWAWFK